jgi:hypothetical protein
MSWSWNGGPTVSSAPSSWSPAPQKDKSPSRTTKPFQHLQRLVAAVVHNRSLARGSRLRPDALMPLDSRRLYPCRCEPQNRRSFSPLVELLPERTSRTGVSHFLKGISTGCWCTASREYIRGGGGTTLSRLQCVRRFYSIKFLCRIISKRTTTTTESIVADF